MLTIKVPRKAKRRVTTRQQDRYTSVTHIRDRNLTEAKQNDTPWARMEGP